MKTFLMLGLLISLITISGCVSIEEVNEGFRRIDKVWQLECQKMEYDTQYRIIDADYQTTFEAVRKTFLDFNMPIQKQSVVDGIIIAENDAPNPLTREEWEIVAKIENPRVKKIGGWMFSMNADPKDYIVYVIAKFLPSGSTTFVAIDYQIDNPKYRKMGFNPTKQAPPLAVEIASDKFWKRLEEYLVEIHIPAPRKGVKPSDWKQETQRVFQNTHSIEEFSKPNTIMAMSRK